MSYEEVPTEIDIPLYYMSWLVARFSEEWSKKVSDLRRRIEGQEPDEVDRIYHEVKDQVDRILIKDEKPEEATIDVYGTKIRKVIVHRKTEKYNGADVYLEVQNEKFALTQFKLQSGGRYKFDNEQLEKLGELCVFCVLDRRCSTICPSFIWLIDDSGFYHKHRILRLCKVNEILNGRSSAQIEEFERHGITRNTFKELLARCWIGAPFVRKPSIQSLSDYSASSNRFVVAFFVGV